MDSELFPNAPRADIALRQATMALIKQLDWKLVDGAESGYELRQYATPTKFVVVASSLTKQGILARVSKLFVYRNYLRLTTQGGQHFWAVRDTRNTTSKAVAKELSVINTSEKFAPKLAGEATVIYLDEDKQLFRDILTDERFPIAVEDDYVWSSGYTTISESHFIGI